MRILILGGSVFLGRALVEQSLAEGHTVTLFNRGLHDVDFSQPVERLVGDREQDLSPLAGRSWDAVVDTCGYLPSVVRRSAQALAGAAGHYTFVSSVSVYELADRDRFDEDTLLAALPPGSGEVMTGETYGPLKALCEDEVLESFGDAALIIRPGMIVGPHDPTDRFAYWPVRVSEGGRLLAPGPPDRAVQLVDVRDLAGWMLTLIERGTSGALNAAGPVERLTASGLLAACPGDAEPQWVDDGFLVERGVVPWSELPFWLPEEGESAAIFAGDVSRSVASGLRFRPVAETCADTLEWFRGQNRAHPDVWLSRAREAELLAEWAAIPHPAG